MSLKIKNFFVVAISFIFSPSHVSASLEISRYAKYGNFPFFRFGTATMDSEYSFGSYKTTDRYIYEKLSKNQMFLGIFDGSIGHECADYLKEHLYKAYVAIKDKDIESEEKLKMAFTTTDKNWLTQVNCNNSGSTAIVTLIDQKKNELFFANTGNSRAIHISNDGKVLFHTTDHTPKNLAEKKSLEDTGQKIEHNRVNGISILSRGFGFKSRKSWLVSNPDVTKKKLNDGDIIVLASDGLWDAMTNEKVAEFIKKKLKKEKNFNTIANKLAQKARKKGSCDNITIVIYRNSSKISEIQHEPWDQNNPERKKSVTKWKILTGIATLLSFLFLYHYNFFFR